MLKDTLKIAIIGKDYTGKSCLASACANKPFETNYSCTIGVDYIVARVKKDNTTVPLPIWDLAGASRFASIVISYIKNCSLIILCYSATDIKSFEDITIRHTHYLNEGYLKNKNIIIVATKTDSPDIHPDYEKWGQEFSTQHNYPFIKTSAKSKEGIPELLDLCSSFVTKRTERLITIDLDSPRRRINKPKKSRNCFFF